MHCTTETWRQGCHQTLRQLLHLHDNEMHLIIIFQALSYRIPFSNILFQSIFLRLVRVIQTVMMLRLLRLQRSTLKTLHLLLNHVLRLHTRVRFHWYIYDLKNIVLILLCKDMVCVLIFSQILNHCMLLLYRQCRFDEMNEEGRYY